MARHLQATTDMVRVGCQHLAVSLALALALSALTFVRYNIAAIEQAVHAHVSAPTDISFLISHFRELPEEAQQYLIWASIFSPTYVCGLPGSTICPHVLSPGSRSPKLQRWWTGTRVVNRTTLTLFSYWENGSEGANALLMPSSRTANRVCGGCNKSSPKGGWFGGREICAALRTTDIDRPRSIWPASYRTSP